MRGRVVVTGLVLAGIVAIAIVGTRVRTLVDLTAEDTLTLTDETEAVVDALDRDVDVTAFIRRDEPGRVEAATLLDRYRKLNRRIDWDMRDPDESPGDAARLGVDPVLGGVAVRSGEDVELAASATEQDVTAALARLLRDDPVEVCVTAGHGERALGGTAADALGEAAQLLERAGLRLRELDLLAEESVPPSCSAVVLAAPTEDLGPALDALAEWTEDDGRLLVLADPVADVDLEPLLAPWGLGLVRGVVFEGDAEAVIGGDVSAPIVRTYSSGHPIVRRLAPTYFPGVQAVLVDDEAEERVPGLTVTRLADTSEVSYLETEPLEAQFDPERDLGGPITVAAAADRSRNTGDVIARSRIVLIGDVDFATTAFVNEAANGRLLARAVEWLTTDDDVLAISANLPSDRPLRLTDARVTYARLLTAVGVPLLFALAGLLMWAVRRSR